MSMLKGLFKTGIAIKAIEIARREAAKPANQAKAKELLAKVTSKAGRTSRS